MVVGCGDVRGGVEGCFSHALLPLSLQLGSRLSFFSFFSASSTLPFAHWLMNSSSLIAWVIPPDQLQYDYPPPSSLLSHIMLTHQKRLHQLLKTDRPSNEEREEIVKLLRSGRYDLPECVFEHSFALLKNNPHSQQRTPTRTQAITSPMTSSCRGWNYGSAAN